MKGVGNLILVAVVAVAGYYAYGYVTAERIDTAPFRADWGSIDGWAASLPEGTAGAEPDPGRLTTVIVFDDSGSMSGEIRDAKAALMQAVAQLPRDGRVAVLGLNSGVIAPMAPVPEAAAALPDALAGVYADGNTPLGAALGQAQEMIEAEAALQRGFGTYRIVVTTDGEASDPEALERAAARILRDTPVEIATIGLGIGRGHPLNLPGLTTYAAVGDVSGLADALAAVSAEQTAFDPVTAFEED